MNTSYDCIERVISYYISDEIKNFHDSCYIKMEDMDAGKKMTKEKIRNILDAHVLSDMLVSLETAKQRRPLTDDEIVAVWETFVDETYVELVGEPESK
jgi:hypothetical protein